MFPLKYTFTIPTYYIQNQLKSDKSENLTLTVYYIESVGKTKFINQKQKVMPVWTRQPQQQEGSYFFSGQFLVTKGVSEALSRAEIIGIYQEIQALVQEKNGLDYLQVFTDEDNRKLFFIDQLNKEMIESGEFNVKEHNYCTLMFAFEY